MPTYQVDVRRLFTQHGVTWRLCHSVHDLVKLDFSNEFNSLHRLNLLNAIYDRLPGLYPYCISAYSQRSVLFYGSFILMSSE